MSTPDFAYRVARPVHPSSWGEFIVLRNELVKSANVLDFIPKDIDRTVSTLLKSTEFLDVHNGLSDDSIMKQAIYREAWPEVFRKSLRKLGGLDNPISNVVLGEVQIFGSEKEPTLAAQLESTWMEDARGLLEEQALKLAGVVLRPTIVHVSFGGLNEDTTYHQALIDTAEEHKPVVISLANITIPIVGVPVGYRAPAPSPAPL